MRLAPLALVLFLPVLGCGHASSSSSSTSATRSRTGVANASRASQGHPTRSLGGRSSTEEGPSAPADPDSPSYGDTARTLYEHGLAEFQDGDCVDAEPIFRRVRREFPYSRYAALADLRVGDCQIKSKSYPEAIQTFSEFVRYRPSHAMVSYARFKIAQCHFDQIPTDWFLVPPAYERDLTEAQDALRTLRRFILDFPEDENVEEALSMARRALRILAGHELYVAKFYRRRDARPAVVRRLETLLHTYEGSGLEPEALTLLGDAYRELELPEQARAVYAELVERFPDSPEAAGARVHLRSLPAPATPDTGIEPERATGSEAGTVEPPGPDAVVPPGN